MKNKLLSLFKGPFIPIFNLCITILLVVIIGMAWYISNKEVTANGITATTSSDNVQIREIMEVKRYMQGEQVSDKFYHADGNKIYYEWDLENEAYILDSNNQKIPMQILSVFPNEYVDITMWYRQTGQALSGGYTIGLSDFDDSEGIFTETIEGVDYSHSSLGVFRVREVTLDEDNKQVINNWSWLATYNDDTIADTKYNKVVFKNGDFDTETPVTIGEVEYYTTTFRIEMNLTQYNELTYTSTNMLSEKCVVINKIELIV